MSRRLAPGTVWLSAELNFEVVDWASKWFGTPGAAFGAFVPLVCEGLENRLPPVEVLADRSRTTADRVQLMLVELQRARVVWFDVARVVWLVSARLVSRHPDEAAAEIASMGWPHFELGEPECGKQRWRASRRVGRAAPAVAPASVPAADWAPVLGLRLVPRAQRPQDGG